MRALVGEGGGGVRVARGGGSLVGVSAIAARFRARWAEMRAESVCCVVRGGRASRGGVRSAGRVVRAERFRACGEKARGGVRFEFWFVSPEIGDARFCDGRRARAARFRRREAPAAGRTPADGPRQRCAPFPRRVVLHRNALLGFSVLDRDPTSILHQHTLLQPVRRFNPRRYRNSPRNLHLFQAKHHLSLKPRNRADDSEPQSGLMYCLCLPYAQLLSRYPRRRRIFQIIGLIVSTVSIALTGFVTAPWQLLILLGITYPLG